CLVWEDAPAGIAAAEAAGATVLVVGATHATPMPTPHPVIADYRGLAVEIGGTGELTLTAGSDN
ncbi:MAG: HAD family hydrolase, partial [Caulobacteraceae bacterium]